MEIKVPGHGPVPCDLMVVGQNPGRLEAAHGKPFIGPSGVMLDKELMKHGIERRDVYATNAVKTYFPGNPSLTGDQLRSERPELVAEVVAVKPRVILALGGDAIKVLVGKGDVRGARGKSLQLHKDYGLPGTVVVATYHPAFLLKNGYKLDEDNESVGFVKAWQDDVARFVRISKQEFTRIPVEYVVNQPADFTGGVVYLDVETSAGGLCLVGCRPVGGPGYLYTADSFGLARSALGSCAAVVAWQAAFDVEQVERNLGISISRFEDPMLKCYLLDETAKQGLKDNAMALLNVEEWEHGIRDRLGKGEQEINEELFYYNAADLTYMEAVDGELSQRLEEVVPLRRVYEKILLPATRMFMDMRRRGIFISEDAIANARVKCGIVREQARVRISLQIGDVNPWSPAQLRYALYDKLGLTVTEYTAKTLQPSVDKLALLKIQNEHPVVRDILAYKEVSKLEQFVTKYQDLRGEDSRIHPETFLTFTVTGRTSCANPNIQQIPRNTLVRSIVSASEGKKLIVADMAQMEPRLAAHLAQERGMIEAFQQGKDVYRMLAQRLLGKQEVSKEERFPAKVITLASIYGATWQTYQEQALKQYEMVVSDKEAQEGVESFHSVWSGFYSWYGRVYDILRKDGYVESAFGRRRRLPAIHSTQEYAREEALRQAVNFTVQSAANDIMLLAAIIMHRYEIPLVAYIHDSIIAEVDEEAAELSADNIKYIMEERVVLYMKDNFGIELTVPLVAEVEICDHWHGVAPKWLTGDNV